MNPVTKFGPKTETDSPLRDAFMSWQCRVRQIAMREKLGRPDNSFVPTVYPIKADQPLTKIITVLCKSTSHSKTPELRHIFKHTYDLAKRREQALEFLCGTYYQRHTEFTDMLTATFVPNSVYANFLENAATCKLIFEAYSQRFELVCGVIRLQKSHPNYQATWWHNLLFNESLHPETVILGFVPDWNSSSACPEINAAI